MPTMRNDAFEFVQEMIASKDEAIELRDETIDALEEELIEALEEVAGLKARIQLMMSDRSVSV